MSKLKSALALIKGERLNARKALNRNALIGAFFLGMLMIGLIRANVITFPPLFIIYFCIFMFYCCSWLVARQNETLRNKLLVIQGILGLLLTLAGAIYFIRQLHLITHPLPGSETFKGRIGHVPGIIATALFYFGRHISDFTVKFKMELKKYTAALLVTGIVLEVIILVKFIKAVSIMFEKI